MKSVKEGFQVHWFAGEDWCPGCRYLGGRCGSNPSKRATSACFCPDRSQHPNCLRAPADANARKAMKIILGLSTGIGSILLIVFIFMGYTHRKNLSQERLLFWKKALTISRNVEAFLENYGSFSPKRYKYTDIKKITGSFKAKLGQGGFGSVYKEKLDDGTSMAVKLLNETKASNIEEEFMNEVASIGRTLHVNEVNLMGFCSEGTKRALVYEFMPNGSLEKYIYSTQDPFKQQNSRHLGWDKLSQVPVGTAKGLEYLHRGCATRILHLDIKPHNILLDRDFCPKISDFGMAKLCPTRDSIVSMLGTRGTVGYIAPEVFSRNFGGVSYKSDVYSYGMMVLERSGEEKTCSRPN